MILTKPLNNNNNYSNIYLFYSLNLHLSKERINHIYEKMKPHMKILFIWIYK